MRTVLFILVALGVAACDGTRPRPTGNPTPRTDGGASLGDGGAVPDSGVLAPPPGGLALAAAAQWLGVNTLTVGVALANAADGTPAPLAPANFQLRTRGGALITATASGGVGECDANVSVLPGAMLSCLLYFELGFGDLPVALTYSQGGRSADSPIPACDVAHPDSICPQGQRCDRGTCEDPCGEEFCLGDRVCVAPLCGEVCSPEHPDGLCPNSGGCNNGTCDASCARIAPSPECTDCISTVSGRCPNQSTCPNPEPCINCTARADLCTCAADPACVACPEILPGLECLLQACPACRG